MRIVSLIPSGTEIVARLGFEAALAGRSHECDFPAAVSRLPICTEAKLDKHVASLEIHRQVDAIVRDGLSVYRVFIEVLRTLQPDVIVTQEQCDVCAVSLQDVEKAVCELVGEGSDGKKPVIVPLKPMCLADVWQDIARVAQALGVPERGEALNRELRERLERVAERARGQQMKPRVATLEWIDPLMAGGNWMPELVALAGGHNLFGMAGEHSPWLAPAELFAKTHDPTPFQAEALEVLAQADPDLLVVLPCGFSLPRAMREMAALTALPGWQRLRAVAEGRVFVTDGNQFFNRPGPRLVESVEILAEIFHPGAFDFGHRGVAWQPLPTAMPASK